MTVEGQQSRRPDAWLPALMLLMSLVAAAIGVVSLYHAQNYLVATTGADLALAAGDIADTLDQILYERYGDIQMTAKALSVQAHDPVAVTEYLTALKKTHPVYLWLAATDAQGRIVAATDPASVGKDRSDHEWFRAVRDGAGIHVRDAQISEDTGGIWAVAFTAPIKGPEGAFLGAVTARVGLPALEETFKKMVRDVQIQRGSGGTIEYQFLTRDGDVIVDSILRQEGTVNLRQLGQLSARLSGSAQPGYVEEQHLRRHVPVVTGYAQTGGHGEFQGLHWGVLVRMDLTDILASTHPLLLKLGIAGGLLFIPMLLMLLWTTGRLKKEWAEEETLRAMVAEAKLQESEQQTRLIIDTAYDAFVAIDADSAITAWNPQSEKIFGWTRGEALGRGLAETIIPPQHRDAHKRGLQRFLTTGEGPVLNKRIEITALRRDGTEFPVELSIRPLKVGDSYTFNAFIADITERKRAHEELQKAKQAADAASRAKSQFLATMSHELRTPLNAIIGFSEVLEDQTFGELNSKQAHYISNVLASGRDLLKLINDILDLSKVEAGHIVLDYSTFEIGPTVQNIVGVVTALAAKTRLTVDIEMDPSLPPLTADQTKFRQIFYNLLSNALKFTPQGGSVKVTVSVDQVRPLDRRAGPRVRLSVTDTGIGLKREDHERIFGEFVQVDSTYARRQQGTGLGLALTRRLVELQDGHIRVDSAGEGQGSTFTVVLRLEPKHAPRGTAPSV